MKEKKTVLIVEDDAVNRRILKRILEDSYTIFEAENGAQAWDILSANIQILSAVILDVFMPVMNGYQFLEKISNAQMAEIPIIVATGASDDESEQKALEAGAWDFITKPYNANVLMPRLRNAIARSEVSAYEKLQRLAEHDSLTGLHTRARMFRDTKRVLKEHPGDNFAFVRMDIDRFSLFNSSFGEAEGNSLLKYLASCIAETVHDLPLCNYGRLNADVFCACFEFDGSKESLEKRMALIQEKVSAFRNDYTLRLSIGVCIVDNNELSVDDFYFKATVAAQKCKNQYEEHIAYYDAATGHQISNEIAIANEMQTALENEQFLVYLQPKFQLSTDSMCGAEALVRWNHPTKGLIPPGLFIPVFEKNGFISKLDYFVWDKTCSIIKSWVDSGKTPFPVSVNISRVSLYNPKLPELLTGLVQKHGIAPALLQLEVTETAYMTNPELMEDTIEALHKVGFTILMDDFGSGYSSLNTLKEIRVDILKVDMKFLPVGDATERAEIVLACVIKMANWLGMSVVVEGVETRRQRDFLEGAGCDCVQGYYYSKPIPVKDYEEQYMSKKLIEDADIPAPEGELAVTPNHNMTILVIDDSETDRAILRSNLEADYHIHVSDSAESGLAYLKKNMSKVKLVLVDNFMPGMSGIEFLRYCRRDNALGAIPKIMITANDSVDNQVAAFNEGAYDYITKPLVKEVVIARVNHVMDISRQTSIFDAVEQEYRLRSERDPLTKLMNKMAFLEIESRMLDTFPDDKVALLVIDIDDFKKVNDSFGHLTGDKVIEAVASCLTNAFRRTDVIGRFGGDEFVVLMTKIPNHDIAKRKAAEIIKSVSFDCAKYLNVNTSISVGLAFSEPDDTSEVLFARADQALYDAKTTGKSKVVVYGEKVPPIIDDDKPVVLVCSEDPQLYPSLALAYGEGAAFAHITSLDLLKETFERYRRRIKAICLDMQKKTVSDSDEFYRCIIENGGGESIPILAVCLEGDMEHLRQALELKISDMISLPPQLDVIQRRISIAIMKADAGSVD